MAWLAVPLTLSDVLPMGVSFVLGNRGTFNARQVQSLLFKPIGNRFRVAPVAKSLDTYNAKRDFTRTAEPAGTLEPGQVP